jgi:hypothetical protein
MWNFYLLLVEMQNDTTIWKLVSQNLRKFSKLYDPTPRYFSKKNRNSIAIYCNKIMWILPLSLFFALSLIYLNISFYSES